jgi:hypothetical protein
MSTADNAWELATSPIAQWTYNQISLGENALVSLFSTIPPERVGLYGEYDYNGLAKRVARSLSESFGLHVVENLYVSQRGRVVILKGSISNNQLLSEVVYLARTIEGATDVESAQVIISYS